jgi:cell division protein FtsW
MPGNSVQRDFLSQAFSDFIFAIVIEELGLLGGGFIVMLYLWLLIRAGRIAKRSDKHFPAFLVMGIALLLVSQAMLNMMVAVGLFPVTGQPLPLISKGGTSTLINCAYIGMILSVSRYVAEKEEQRRQMELQNNENELQAAAQALVIQAKKMANAETEEYEDIAMEVPQTLNPASDNIKEQNNS